jgi:hypothetical protein
VVSGHINDGPEQVTLAFSPDKDRFTRKWVFVPGLYGGPIGSFDAPHLWEYLAERNVLSVAQPGW